MESSVLYKAETSKVDLIIHIALLFVFVGIFTIWGAIKRRNSYLEVYPDEVVAKQGMASKRALSYPLNSIQAISVEQGLMGRIFNYGNITISTAGTGYISLQAIDNPEEVKRIIYELKSR